MNGFQARQVKSSDGDEWVLTELGTNKELERSPVLSEAVRKVEEKEGDEL